MRERTEEVVRRLGERAEEACRRYLSNGRKIGGYWIVGDRRNAKGRSLFLRLKSNGPGAAGKWTDGATGEHGDLLDIIRAAIGSEHHADALAEAEQFLGLSRADYSFDHQQRDSAAARLFAGGRPIAGTLAARYLRSRGINVAVAGDALRFHPKCYYRAPDAHRGLALPAMLAAVTDNAGRVTGLMRTYLAADGLQKAPIDAPRRAMGSVVGNGVRFGPNAEIMAAGEGVETVLSLRMAMPNLSAVAALSAAHLSALIPPLQARRLYIAVDGDSAGRDAAVRLAERLSAGSIETVQLTPRRKDFNDDLVAGGPHMLAAQLADQIAPEDKQRFIGARRRNAG